MTTPESTAPGGRVPPQNLEAEQSVLGTILLKDQSLGTVLEILQPANFYRPAHKQIFEAMIQLFERNEPQDLITVTNQLKNSNKLDEVGGAAYLAMLTSMVPVTSNLAHYARIIRQKAI